MSEPSVKTLIASFGHSHYPVVIGEKIVRYLPDFLPHADPANRLFVITDQTVHRLHLKSLIQPMAPFFPDVETLMIPEGEANKNIRTLEKLCVRLQKGGADRQSTLLAFGGGVIGDLTGMVAALYHRGIRYIQIPTTLIAMADSALGGKTAVNLPAGKNLIGCFYPPSAIFADVTYLRTLMDKDFRAGFAEVLKYGLAADRSFFRYLVKNEQRIFLNHPETLTEIIYRCMKIKNHIVRKDPYDTAQRRILNFGHTFAHALESSYTYGWIRHGEAVMIGMLMATELSVLTGRLQEPDAQIIRKILLQNIAFICRQRGIAKKLKQLNPIEFLQRFHSDKKHIRNQYAFTLLTGIGQAETGCSATPAQIRSAIKISFNQIFS